VLEHVRADLVGIGLDATEVVVEVGVLLVDRLAMQFDRFTRRILNPDAEPEVAVAGRKGPLRFDRITSIW